MISLDAIVIAGSILIVGIVILYIWVVTEHRKEIEKYERMVK